MLISYSLIYLVFLAAITRLLTLPLANHFLKHLTESRINRIEAATWQISENNKLFSQLSLEDQDLFRMHFRIIDGARFILTFLGFIIGVTAGIMTFFSFKFNLNFSVIAIAYVLFMILSIIMRTYISQRKSFYMPKTRNSIYKNFNFSVGSGCFLSYAITMAIF